MLWLWAMLTFQHIYIWVTFQILFFSPFKYYEDLFWECQNVLCFKIPCMQLHRAHTFCTHFFNVLNALEYKDSEFVAEMLVWDKLTCALIIKGWVVMIVEFLGCNASLCYSWLYIYQHDIFASIRDQQNTCIKMDYGAISFVNTLHALLSRS